MRLGMAAVSVHHQMQATLCKLASNNQMQCSVYFTVSRGRGQRGSGSATLDLSKYKATVTIYDLSLQRTKESPVPRPVADERRATCDVPVALSRGTV